jgi:hypothetical protein
MMTLEFAIRRGSLVGVLCVSAMSCWALPAASAQYTAYWLYSGRRGTTVVAPPAGPGQLDPLSVSARFGFWPYPIIARQPIGHQVLATGPNGYAYRPVYADDPTAASIAIGDDVPGGAARGFLAAHGHSNARRTAAPPPAMAGGAQPAHAGGAADGLSAALDDFRAARYESALDRLSAIGPANEQYGTARMLAAEAHLALTEYDAAVASLASGMDSLPEQEWDRYVRDYRDYFASALRFFVHLRSLERFVQQHQADTNGHLLLGFHYAALGYTDEGLAELALAGDDPRAQRLAAHFRLENEAPAPALDVVDEPEADAAPRRGREF